ncbi:hypothetical protein LTSEADE_3097 [Salmonella enterica subsp. enterica serovar Adelaide str. A4-669]|uniref:Uncharacterized protein n=1 Tax=Salmonella enterica subsp. enterica serovar Adelaide str. A4-669 TaxID=913063 RepID=A0A6C8GM20_SALET|nr:hypothetical protein LTSEADE_3097 [Salmonella enterica subsp. enterica serovar Adelaide str. A4-669]
MQGKTQACCPPVMNVLSSQQNIEGVKKAGLTGIEGVKKAGFPD